MLDSQPVGPTYLKKGARMRTLCAVLLLLTGNAAATECYMGLGMGQSTISYSGVDRIEARIFELEYVSGDYEEKSKSMTWELSVGCVVSKRYGLKWELGLLEGFRHKVHTRGRFSVGSYDGEFTIDRIVRARGYMLSGLFEKQLSKKSHAFVRLGAIYATAMADIHPMGSEYSVHGERESLVPVVGVGLRFAIDDRWSATGEYRLIGVPWEKDRRISQGLGLLNYSFR